MTRLFQAFKLDGAAPLPNDKFVEVSKQWACQVDKLIRKYGGAGSLNDPSVMRHDILGLIDPIISRPRIPFM